jgi:hypothetical protein
MMWSEGIEVCPKTGEKYKFWIKRYEEGSQFSINGGEINKITIRKLGETRDLCCYDRGWGQEPTSEVEAVYAIILEKYN